MIHNHISWAALSSVVPVSLHCGMLFGIIALLHSQDVLPSSIVLIVTDCLAISTSTSNISPSELCSFMDGMIAV